MELGEFFKDALNNSGCRAPNSSVPTEHWIGNDVAGSYRALIGIRLKGDPTTSKKTWHNSRLRTDTNKAPPRPKTRYSPPHFAFSDTLGSILHIQQGWQTCGHRGMYFRPSFTWIISITQSNTHESLPIPGAARSKAWVFGRSLAGNAGSNPARDMPVFHLSVLCVVRWRSCVGLISRPDKSYWV